MEIKIVLISIGIGIISGLLTVFIVPVKFEILIWLAVIGLLAVLFVRYDHSQLFRSTFIYSALTGVAITSTHLLFLSSYLTSHPEEQKLLVDLGIRSAGLALLIIAPAYWVILGLATGGMTLLLRRFL